MIEADPYTYAKAPVLGRDTAEVLTGLLHMDDNDVAYFTKE